MITVAGKLSLDDYLSAQRFHARSRSIILSVALGALAVLVWSVSGEVFVPALFAFYVLVVRPIHVRLRLKRRWRQTPSAHGEARTFGLDEAGFHAQDDEGAASVAHWGQFLKYRESKTAFLLYLSPEAYVLLPKRFMSPESQEAARALLKEKVKGAVP